MVQWFFFFCLIIWKLYIKSSNQADASDFQHLIWTSWLFPVFYNYSQVISWFDHEQHQLVYQAMEYYLALNLMHKTWQTDFDAFSHCYLLHELHKSPFLPFFKKWHMHTKKINFLLYSLLESTNKNIPIWTKIIFVMCRIWQLP